jgi:2-C-methyl-D-erythritol 4-phosphate cytidylyltransferase
MINNQQDTNRFSFLLLSGGVGQRSDHYEPKQFYELHGHPLIAYSLIAATQVDEIAEIIVNSPPGYEERTENILKAYCRTTSYHIIESGKSRQESCHRLAKAANFAKVIVHEAARPFVTPSSIKELVCEH